MLTPSKLPDLGKRTLTQNREICRIKVQVHIRNTTINTIKRVRKHHACRCEIMGTKKFQEVRNLRDYGGTPTLYNHIQPFLFIRNLYPLRKKLPKNEKLFRPHSIF